MKHTPGPWNVCEPVGWMVQDRYWTVEQMREMWWVGKRPGVAIAIIDGSVEGRSEAEANARLIAAAPDMLDALYYVIGAADRSSEVYSKARQAIDKATKP